MRINTIIIDDDDYVRELLSENLKEFETQLNVIGSYHDPFQAIPFVKENLPVLLFLDIQMPGMSGFELLDELDTEHVDVVFITSYDQYAIQAIRYSALDYLLKPIRPAELKAAVDRCMEKSEKKLQRMQLENLRHNLTEPNQQRQQVVIPFRSGQKRVALEDIISLEADSNYSWINIRQSGKVLASKTLKDFENMLDEEIFIRPNRSLLLNKNFITGYHGTKELYLRLNDDSEVLVSRRRATEIREKLATLG